MNTNEISKLSIVERFQIMEVLWDSFKNEQSQIESPDWHKDILQERKEKIDSGKSEFISISALRASRR